MFDIGISELLMIAVVALVVIGPERLPGVARNVGRYAGRVQRYVHDIKRDFNREVEFEEIRRLQQEMESTVQSMQASVRAVETSLQQEVKPREEILATTLEQAKQNLDDLKAQVERLEHSAPVPPDDNANPQAEALPPSDKPPAKQKREKKQPDNLASAPEATNAPTTSSAVGEGQFNLF